MLSQPTGQHVTRVTEEKSINQSINQSRLVCSDTASAEAPFQLALRSTPRDILAVACSSRRLEVGAASDIKNSCLA